MSPLIFVPVAFFGTCATLTILFVFCAREYRSWKPAPNEIRVQPAKESLSPPGCLNEWERRYWSPDVEMRVRANCRPMASGVHTGRNGQ